MNDLTQPAALNGAKILVVDDEPSNIEVISQFLRLEGYQIIRAVDGEEALDRVNDSAPDLVLLDIRMPRLDGYEVCHRLKTNPETIFLPVVMITALQGSTEKIKGVEVGADDFLTKPFNHLELVTRVKSLLRVKQLHDQLEDYRRDLEKRVVERTAELQHALEELRELDRLKSEFVGRVSHELRTPLLHVKGYVALLADETLGPLNPEQRQGLDTAIKAAEHLERLVEDIVDFGSAGVGRIELQPVSLPEVARAAVNMLERAWGPKQVRINIDLPARLPLVRADPKSLTRCLRHLLDNAVKFSRPGSPVDLRAEVLIEGRSVRMSVRDRGIGIPQDQLDKIFQAFYQVDGSTTRRYGGAGVGLSLVKMLLEAHGTSIRAESVVGVGSTFYFDLPVVN